MNSLVWLVLDSCRYDSFDAARTPAFDAFATANDTQVEKRWSHASWTAPSHYSFLMGLPPHQNQPGQFASAVYTAEYQQWSSRLGISDLDFQKFLPQLSLPRMLQEFGYRTVARVSLPVLNESTLLSSHFDDYRLMNNHNDFAGMIDEIQFSSEQPHFYFFNLGETHYPYMLDAADLPRLSGVHGVLRDLGHGDFSGAVPEWFDDETMRRLHAQQMCCVEYVDGLFAKLCEKCPAGTHVIITADHGEVFGEDGYFGHGPVIHDKVFEVPYLEGKIPGDAAARDADHSAQSRADSDQQLRAAVLEKMKGLGYLE